MANLVNRLINHMDIHPAGQDRPRRVARGGRGNELLPWIDPENFDPNYLQRGLPLRPKCGSKPEWAHSQNQRLEKDTVPGIDLDDAAFSYC